MAQGGQRRILQVRIPQGQLPSRTIFRRVGLAVSLGIAAVVLSGCSINNSVLRFGWPEGVTPQAGRMRELWTWSVIAALVMGVVVWGLTFWTVIFHRKKKDSPEFPRQTGYNVPLELGYTAAPFVIIAVLFYFTVVAQNYVHEKTSDPDVTIDVTAFQWNWKFGYREAPAFGYTNGEYLQDVPEEIKQRQEELALKEGQDLSYLHNDKIETVGSSEEIPVLVLPTGKRVEFVLNSADVIHAFWVPEFLFKRDVMPEPKKNGTDNIFQITEIEREGAFVGRCAEMCGAFHSMMNFEVRAVSPEKFKIYLEARETGMTNAEALKEIHESQVSTSTVPFNTNRTGRAATVADGN